MLCESDAQHNYIDDEETSAIDTSHVYCTVAAMHCSKELTAARWLTISCDDGPLV